MVQQLDNGASSSSDAEPFEVVAAKVDELKNGEMKHVPIPGRHQQVLFGRAYDGTYFAMGTACTHYNAFLKNGVLGVNRIRCPWHGACFNIKTGDIEEYPCTDDVHVFQVQTVGDDLVIRGDGRNVDIQRRTSAMCKHNPVVGKEHVLIIGAGPAGLICAETLRKNGFEGRVTLLTNEAHPPYDRPKLSKALDSNIDKILLRKAEFLRENDIDLQTNSQVSLLDIQKKTALVNHGTESESIHFDYLVIATGQRARKLGHDWSNVHYIRTIEDANRLFEAAKGKKVAILGSSFIAMESAAYLVGKAASVTVISKTRVPYQAAFGNEVGEAIKFGLFDKKGVSFLPSVEVLKYEGTKDDTALKSIHLSDGTVLEPELLLVGIGSEPNTEFLKGTGVELGPGGALIVDEFMTSNIPYVFGAGDCTEFPLTLYGGVRTTVGHWNVAFHQGKIAALNILGKKTPLVSVPYFWTAVFGKSIRYAGYGYRYTEHFVHGSLSDQKFVIYYLKGGEVVAAASLMYDPVVSRFAELVSNRVKITRDMIVEDPELVHIAEKAFSRPL